MVENKECFETHLSIGIGWSDRSVAASITNFLANVKLKHGAHYFQSKQLRKPAQLK